MNNQELLNQLYRQDVTINGWTFKQIPFIYNATFTIPLLTHILAINEIGSEFDLRFMMKDIVRGIVFESVLLSVVFLIFDQCRKYNPEEIHFSRKVYESNPPPAPRKDGIWRIIRVPLSS